MALNCENPVTLHFCPTMSLSLATTHGSKRKLVYSNESHIILKKIKSSINIDRENIHNKNVVLEEVECILQLTKEHNDDDVLQNIIRVGGITSLLFVMDQYKADIGIITKCCSILASWSEHYPDLFLRHFNYLHDQTTQNITLLLSLTNDYFNHEEILNFISITILKLTTDENLLKIILSLKSFPTFERIIKTPRLTVNSDWYIVIYNLSHASFINEEKYFKLEELSQLFIDGLNTYTKSDLLKYNLLLGRFCLGLVNLLDHTNVIEYIHSHLSIAFLFSIMKKFSTNYNILKSSSMLCTRLVLHESAENQMKDLIDLLFYILQESVKDEEIVLCIVTSINQILGKFWKFSNHIVEHIAKNQGIVYVITALEIHQDDCVLVEELVTILCRMMFDFSSTTYVSGKNEAVHPIHANYQHDFSIFHIRLIPLLIILIKQYLTNNIIVCQIGLMIKLLSSTSVSRCNSFAATILVDVFLECMQCHRTDRNLTYEIAAAIQNITLHCSKENFKIGANLKLIIHKPLLLSGSTFVSIRPWLKLGNDMILSICSFLDDASSISFLTCNGNMAALELTNRFSLQNYYSRHHLQKHPFLWQRWNQIRRWKLSKHDPPNDLPPFIQVLSDCSWDRSCSPSDFIFPSTLREIKFRARWMTNLAGICFPPQLRKLTFICKEYKKMIFGMKFPDTNSFEEIEFGPNYTPSVEDILALPKSITRIKTAKHIYLTTVRKVKHDRPEIKFIRLK